MNARVAKNLLFSLIFFSCSLSALPDYLSTMWEATKNCAYNCDGTTLQYGSLAAGAVGSAVAYYKIEKIILKNRIAEELRLIEEEEPGLSQKAKYSKAKKRAQAYINNLSSLSPEKIAPWTMTLLVVAALSYFNGALEVVPHYLNVMWDATKNMAYNSEGVALQSGPLAAGGIGSAAAYYGTKKLILKNRIAEELEFIEEEEPGLPQNIKYGMAKKRAKEYIKNLPLLSPEKVAPCLMLLLIGGGVWQGGKYLAAPRLKTRAGQEKDALYELYEQELKALVDHPRLQEIQEQLGDCGIDIVNATKANWNVFNRDHKDEYEALYKKMVAQGLPLAGKPLSEVVREFYESQRKYLASLQHNVVSDKEYLQKYYSFSDGDDLIKKQAALIGRISGQQAEVSRHLEQFGSGQSTVQASPESSPSLTKNISLMVTQLPQVASLLSLGLGCGAQIINSIKGTSKSTPAEQIVAIKDRVKTIGVELQQRASLDAGMFSFYLVGASQELFKYESYLSTISKDNELYVYAQQLRNQLLEIKKSIRDYAIKRNVPLTPWLEGSDDESEIEFN